jgi:hypothetical protein
MIGHALLQFYPEAEDRVLTQPMRSLDDGGPCLLVVSHNHGQSKLACRASLHLEVCDVGQRYDKLCARFGTERVNAAIRNRILSNRARRVLQNRPVHEVASR